MGNYLVVQVSTVSVLSLHPKIVASLLALTGIVLLGLALSLAPNLASASDNPGVIDNVHQQVSEQFVDLAGDVDGLFGGASDASGRNRSWARIRLGATKFESEDAEFRGNIKLKLVLPRTEERLQLLLSTEDEDNLDAGQGRNTTLTGSGDENVSLALRFLQSVRSRSSFRFDLGVRLRDDRAQAFARLNASRRFSPETVSEVRDTFLVNNLWYFSRSGYENRLKLLVRRPVNLELIEYFQSSSEVIWKQGEPGARYVQKFDFVHLPSDATAIAFETQGDVYSSPEPGEKRLQAIEFKLRFRQQVWRPWFFYEVLPRIRWEAEQDYSARFGMQVRAEIFFGSFANAVSVAKK